MLQKQILSVPSSREEISEIPNFSSCALSVFLFWRKCFLHFYLSEQKYFFNSLNSFHLSWVINLMMVELKLILKFYCKFKPSKCYNETCCFSYKRVYLALFAVFIYTHGHSLQFISMSAVHFGLSLRLDSTFHFWLW